MPTTSHMDDVVIDDAYWAQFPAVLKIENVAKIMRKSEVSVWRWLSQGKIPAHQVAGAWIVYKESLQRRLEDSENIEFLPVEFLATFEEELSVDDVALILGRKKATIYKWLAAEAIPAKHFHGSWLIYKSEIIQMLKQTYKTPNTSQR